MDTKSSRGSRSSRRQSLSSSRASSVGNMQLPEIDEHAPWRKHLYELLGENGADYFLNPKPKNHTVKIDDALYQCHGLDDAWKILRDKAEQKLLDFPGNTSSSRRSNRQANLANNQDMWSGDELDGAYFAFGRQLLHERGRHFPSRSFWPKQQQFEKQLEKLSNKHGKLRAAKYNQETGVSYRAASINTERCAHLANQNSTKGGVFERNSDTLVFLDDIADKDSELASKVNSRMENKTATPTRQTRSKYIFLTTRMAESTDETLDKLTTSKDLWSRKAKKELPVPVITENRANHTSSHTQWEPLSLSATDEWGGRTLPKR